MATEPITARELAALVKPVRALFTKKNKIAAIRLVRERTKCSLNESEEFVQHVESWPGAKAVKVAELWTSAGVGESISNTPDHRPTPAGTSNGDARERPSGTSMSLAEWYARYMQSHTYAEWEQLVERCIAARLTDELKRWAKYKVTLPPITNPTEEDLENL
jgi:hypothetical protein